MPTSPTKRRSPASPRAGQDPGGRSTPPAVAPTPPARAGGPLWRGPARGGGGGAPRLSAGVTRLWASIHIAGGFAYAPIGDTTVAILRHQIDMNFVSCFLCCRAAVAAMSQSADGGRIVNVAARPALEGRAGANMTAYAASKAAVATLTMALAEEVAAKN